MTAIPATSAAWIPNVYSSVAPVVLLTILAEYLICLRAKNGYYTLPETVTGLSTTFLAQILNVWVAAGVFHFLSFVHTNLAFSEIPNTPLSFIGCFLLTDLLFYFFHRAGHRINLFWALHIPHHSTREMIYAVALRTGLLQRAASFVFYWPLALLGFTPELILPVIALNLTLQILPHTRLFSRAPAWLELWLNTPGHHQVHHGKNPQYCDKNYAGVFIIWDRLFGTFEPLQEPVDYGVTSAPRSLSPWEVNFHRLRELREETRALVRKERQEDPQLTVLRATRLTLKHWLMPPGTGNAPTEPRSKQHSLEVRALSPQEKIWLILQVGATLPFVLLLMKQDGDWGTMRRIVSFALVWTIATSWSKKLDQPRTN